jgi:hypothetical protein
LGFVLVKRKKRLDGRDKIGRAQSVESFFGAAA